jgi:hypothetical protein
MDEDEARQYSDVFAILEERVKPERQHDNRPARRERFWRFGEIAKGLYSQLARTERAIARLFTCEYWFWDFITPGPVFTNALVIVTDGTPMRFAALSSSVHEVWAGLEASSLVTRFRYTPSRCFETFPFPSSYHGIDELSERYRNLRRDVMLDRNEGLTKIYEHFHCLGEESKDIQDLRALHRELDAAVTIAYGWGDLELSHGFYETKQGVRYTISETDRREVLDRLLQLNHERYAEEVRLGLHDKKSGKGRKKMSLATVKAADDELVKPQLFE